MVCGQTLAITNEQGQAGLSSSLSIVLADAKEVVRVGLTMCLTNSGFKVADECSTADELLERVQHECPDIILLDMQLPGCCAIELCLKLTTGHQQSKVIVISDCEDSVTLFSAMCAGAHGFFSKLSPVEELVVTIKAALNKERRFISSSRYLDRYVAEDGSPTVPNSLDQLLSPRKRELLALVSEGKTNKQIAVDLNLSEKTVKNYLSEIFVKLNVNRRSEAAAVYSRYQLHRSLWYT